MAPRETPGSLAHRKASSRSRGADCATEISLGEFKAGSLPAAVFRFQGCVRAFGGGRRDGGFRAEGKEDEQADPHTDRAVGDVEGGKADFTAAAGKEVETEKINDLLAGGIDSVK